MEVELPYGSSTSQILSSFRDKISAMGGFMAKAFTIAGEIVFPPACLACGKNLARAEEKLFWVCDVCRSRIKNGLPGFFCPVCERRLPDDSRHPHAQFIALAPLSYADPAVQTVIRAFKYDGAKGAARFLSARIGASFENCFAINKNFKFQISNSVILPLPLHPSRENKRGFNQSLLIAQELAKPNGVLGGVPLVKNALVKIHPTGSQTKKETAAERERNIIGSFAVRNAYAIAGRDIFIVDDVFTTGATLREAVRVLKESGAGRIIALVAARA
jgi:competence protein ComFC